MAAELLDLASKVGRMYAGMSRALRIHRLLEKRHEELAGLNLEARYAHDEVFLTWWAEVELIIRKGFGGGSAEHSGFVGIGFMPRDPPGCAAKAHREAYQAGLHAARRHIETLLTQLVWFDYADELQGDPPKVAGERIARILDRFHAAALALGSRNRRDRAALSIADEYDVQFVLRALLAVEFADVRLEEYTPSHAGASARADFLLKPERTIVEVKMTRAGLADRKIGEDLTVDIERYRKHPDCGQLYCFVYDPGHRIVNAIGLEQDLCRNEPLPVRVFIRPSR